MNYNQVCKNERNTHSLSTQIAGPFLQYWAYHPNPYEIMNVFDGSHYNQFALTLLFLNVHYIYWYNEIR